MTKRWEYETDHRGRPVSVWQTERRFATVTNLQHSLVRAAYDRRCRQLGVQSLDRWQRAALDLELVERFGLDERTPADVRWALTQPPYAALPDAKKPRRSERTPTGIHGEDGNLSRPIAARKV